jgi:molecular chaperone GrpE
MAKKPEKIDVERALSDKPPKGEAGSAEGDIQIVEVVGGEPGEGVEPAVTRPSMELQEAPRPEAAPQGRPEVGAAGAAPAEQLAALTDRLRRMAAEHDNYRKRVERDRAEQREQANSVLVAELLPVLDSFERALGGQAGELPGEVRSGLGLIHRQLLDALIRAGLEPMQAAGQEFNPEIHDAVATTQDPRIPAGRVIEVFDAGYRFRGRLLRPARVRVSAGTGGS